MTTSEPAKMVDRPVDRAQVREKRRERLRKWHATPEAVENACLDAKEVAGFWATRDYLLRAFLRDAAENGDPTAKAALEWDEGHLSMLKDGVTFHEAALRATALEGLKLERRVVIDTTTGPVGPATVTCVVGAWRAAVVHLVTDDGVPVQVDAEDATGYRFV